jgi:hypothetical protein
VRERPDDEAMAREPRAGEETGEARVGPPWRVHNERERLVPRDRHAFVCAIEPVALPSRLIWTSASGQRPGQASGACHGDRRPIGRVEQRYVDRPPAIRTLLIPRWINVGSDRAGIR